MRALGPVMQGIDFPVVRVCLPEDYQADEDAGDWPTGIHWPLTSVQATKDAEVFEAMASS